MASRADRIRRAGRSGVWSALALLYLFIPIFIVVLFSFNDNQGRFNFTWQGFTLDHWEHPFANPDLATALKNSLLIALISTLIATALGHVHGAGARALPLPRARRRSTSSSSCRWRRPRSCSAPRCSALFLTMGIATGFATIVIAHVMFTISYVVVTVKARLEGMDRHIEEAAMDLGATEWATFRKVTLPMIAPGRRRRRAAGRRDLDRRLRDHELQRRPDADVPAVHLRRHAPGRAARGQRARDRAAGDRARADGAERGRAAPARRARRGAHGADAARRRASPPRVRVRTPNRAGRPSRGVNSRGAARR